MKMRRKTQPKENVQVHELSIQRMAILSDIYKNNNWKIEDEFYNEYEQFCKMLRFLKDDEQELVLELTKNFLKINSGEYVKFFLLALDKFINSTTLKDKKIYITPLLRKADIGKNKSSTALYYFIKAEIKKLQHRYEGYSISLYDNVSFLDAETWKIKPSQIICLIDDFIGTGETALDAANEVIEKGVEKSNLVVLALVAQKDGIEQIINQGYNVFTAVERVRAISDRMNHADEKKLIMEELEKRMGVDSDCQFGYGHSEALVKMIRTPNNTFPIYWYAQSKTIRDVPFPR
jgi:hypothetical protein